MYIALIVLQGHTLREAVVFRMIRWHVIRKSHHCIYYYIQCNESHDPVGYAQVEADLTNGRKQEAWDDVTESSNIQLK